MPIDSTPTLARLHRHGLGGYILLLFVFVVVLLLSSSSSSSVLLLVFFVRPSKYSMFRQLLSLGIPITRDGRRLGGSAANNIQVISALALKDDILSRSHTFFFKQLDSVLNHGRRMNTLRVQMLQDRFLDACRVYSLLLGREFGGWRRVGAVSYTHLTLPTICSV